MKLQGALPLIAACLLAAALAACGDATSPPPASDPGARTAVLGGYGHPARAAASGPLTDASGRAIPAPPLARKADAQMVRSGPDGAIAAWVQDDRVVTARYAPATGWTVPVPLEDIYGKASRPQLAGNGTDTVLAVWQHTVGSIQSLRFSRFDGATGWSTPDVMPGALPRPPQQARGSDDAPQLHMDVQGNVFAQWPSGFSADEVQTARYVAGHGWTRALSEPVTAAAAPSGQSTTSLQ